MVNRLPEIKASDIANVQPMNPVSETILKHTTIKSRTVDIEFVIDELNQYITNHEHGAVFDFDVLVELIDDAFRRDTGYGKLDNSPAIDIRSHLRWLIENTGYVARVNILGFKNAYGEDYELVRLPSGGEHLLFMSEHNEQQRKMVNIESLKDLTLKEANELADIVKHAITGYKTYGDLCVESLKESGEVDDTTIEITKKYFRQKSYRANRLLIDIFDAINVVEGKGSLKVSVDRSWKEPIE